MPSDVQVSSGRPHPQACSCHAGRTAVMQEVLCARAAELGPAASESLNACLFVIVLFSLTSKSHGSVQCQSCHPDQIAKSLMLGIRCGFYSRPIFSLTL